MPRITLSVKDVDQSVTRPVIMEVVRDILKITNLVSETSILFPGNAEVGYQPDTTLSSKIDNREKNTFSHGKRVFIDIDEDYIEEGAIANAVMKAENAFIYVDRHLGCYIKPVYASMEATINFRYRARDRVEAARWRDHVRTKIGMGRRDLIHHPTYSYIIPDSALIMLKEIHRLRENVAGYGDTFREYLDSHFTNRKTIAVTQAGTEPRDLITEQQRRVIGRFDFSNKPEKAERDGQADAWVISFSYRLYYEKPINLVMLYPLVIHNQLLSVKYRADKPTDRDNYHLLNHNLSTSGFRPFEPDYMIDKYKATRGISIPDFDDFIPSQILPNTIRVLTGLVLIDEDSDILMNFRELGDWDMDEEILEFMVGEAPYITKQYHSVLNVSFYRNYDMMGESLQTVHVDNNLNVRVNNELSLRDYHHVRLSINTDLESLTNDAKDRLRRRSRIFKKIIEAIYPKLDLTEDDLHRLEKDGPVTREELEKIIQTTTKFPQRSDPANRIGYNTVQGFFVRARKEYQRHED